MKKSKNPFGKKFMISICLVICIVFIASSISDLRHLPALSLYSLFTAGVYKFW